MNAIQPWMVLNALNLERLNRAPAFNDWNAFFKRLGTTGTFWPEPSGGRIGTVVLLSRAPRKRSRKKAVERLERLEPG